MVDWVLFVKDFVSTVVCIQLALCVFHLTELVFVFSMFSFLNALAILYHALYLGFDYQCWAMYKNAALCFSYIVFTFSIWSANRVRSQYRWHYVFVFIAFTNGVSVLSILCSDKCYGLLQQASDTKYKSVTNE